MFKAMVWNSFTDYSENLRLSLVLGVLLIFVFFFQFFENMFISSGSIFLEYNLQNLSPLTLLFELVALIVFLVFYSALLSLIIFNVRNKLTKMKLDYYLRDKLHKFGFTLFVFFFLFFLCLFVLASALVFFGIPVLYVNLLLLVLSFLFLFVPQSIVVDEKGIWHSVQSNFSFILSNASVVLKTVAVSVALLALLPLVEFAFDFAFFLGRYTSLVVLMVFMVPFIEILKTRAYMSKFGLVKPHA